MNTDTGNARRRQASLFLSGFPEIEEFRHRFNPAQAALIPAHVTLCREDEVEDWSALQDRIRAVGPIDITIEFGIPIRQEHFVYLPVVESTVRFENLRLALLGTPTQSPRLHLPHLTIIHPRNGVCTDAIFQELLRHFVPFSASFCEISLIEQRDGGPWSRFACFGQ